MDKKGEKVLRLIDLKRDNKACIIGIDSDKPTVVRKLMSLGVMPGLDIRVIQTYPAVVFNVGYTRVAVDNEIASVIQVAVN